MGKQKEASLAAKAGEILESIISFLATPMRGIGKVGVYKSTDLALVKGSWEQVISIDYF